MNAAGYQGSYASIPYTYNDLDALKSVRRYLARSLSPGLLAHGTPGPDEPWIYYKPVPEGQFQRPAITIRFTTTVETLPTIRRAAAISYWVMNHCIITAYGADYEKTMVLGGQIFDLLNGGDPTHHPWRIPLWNFAAGVKVARYARLLSGSLSMGLEDTDDLGKWYRPIELELDVPRARGAVSFPIIQAISTEINGN